MSQISKSKSYLDLLNNRSVKNLSQFGQNINPYQHRNKQRHSLLILNKSNHSSSSKSIRNNNQTENRSNDYIKKLIFDNQELMWKNKQLQKKCNALEYENNQLSEKYQELKQNYLDLRERYQLIDPCLQAPLKMFQKKEQQGLNIFGLFLGGKATNVQSKQQPTRDCSQKVFKKTELKSRPSIKQNNFIPCIKIDQKIIKTVDSVSLMVDFAEVQTQTDDDLIQYTSSSKEAELIMQISKYKITILELEKKLGDVTYKYDRIKAIIGGHESKAH